MKENELPNYYSVIPANVRYCSDLSFFEIVLYSEISALSNALGYCFASNSYFANLYKKAPETISRSITKLEENGFIRSEVEKKNGNKRKLFITPIDKNINTPIDENIKHNTTSVNTKLKQSARASEEKNKESLVDMFNRIYKGWRPSK